MENERPRSRRELREQEKRQAKSLSIALKLRRGVPKLVLVGLVASVTVIAPLTGLVSPNLSIASPSLDFKTNETLLSVVANASSYTQIDSTLNAVPISRSRVVEASKLGRCISAEKSANGDLAAAPESPLLLWPMYSGSYRYSSPWGMRINPVTGTRMMHEGVDWTAPAGTDIYAVADGTVVEAGMLGSTGTITIKHELDGEIFYSRYLHMYRDGIYVNKGDQVKAGEIVAAVGSTGRSTGPHLHFEIRNEAKDSVEPMDWMKKHGAIYINRSCE